MNVKTAFGRLSHMPLSRVLTGFVKVVQLLAKSSKGSTTLNRLGTTGSTPT